jgi:hypothetical protein
VLSSRAILVWSAIWATAFGFVEGSVVVYLRELFYPNGFAFPLEPFDPELIRVELVREAATMVMLLGVACLAAHGRMRRFGVFSFCFGVWDLAYYTALWLVLDWPASVMDWDILFLIPISWTAPVLAPVLVSFALIAAGIAIVREPEGRDWSFLRPTDWVIEIVAGLIIIGSFVWNEPQVQAGTIPVDYPWWLFMLGWLTGLGWFLRRWRVRDLD